MLVVPYVWLSVKRDYSCGLRAAGHAWKYEKHPCCDGLSELVSRSKESEIFYARIDTGRKTVKKSLKTRVLTEALSRLAGFLAEQGRDELPVESVSWYLAVDMYVQRQEMRPHLKPAAVESIKFFSSRAKSLLLVILQQRPSRNKCAGLGGKKMRCLCLHEQQTEHSLL